MDNGASTQVDLNVAKTIKNYFLENYGNASSLHRFGQDAYKSLQNARKTIAEKLNAKPEEIIFTSGGTESDNLAIKGVADAKGKGHIITSKIEHPAVLNTCKELEKKGFTVTYLEVDEYGLVDLRKLEESIKKETILITIMHANNEIGTIQPIAEIGKIADKHNILFHTDAVQTFTKEPINVLKINVDMISLSAHKIHGPKGVGALYVRLGTPLVSQIQGGVQERRIRAGTENIPGILGFAEAAKLDNQITNIRRLSNKLTAELLKIPHTKLNGHPQKRLANNVNISFKFVEGEGILFSLDQKGIAVSTGSACSSHSLEPSHVLLAIGLKHEIAHGAIRFTLSKNTTEEEVDYVIYSVKEVIEKLRKMSPVQAE